jgi:hypothetical protein
MNKHIPDSYTLLKDFLEAPVTLLLLLLANRGFLAL